RLSNSAVENQAAARIEKKGVARCFSSEPMRFCAVEIGDDSNSGNLRRTSPGICVLPISSGQASPARISWRIKQNVNERFVLDARHHMCELVDTRAGAWTLRMREHHQRRTLTP